MQSSPSSRVRRRRREELIRLERSGSNGRVRTVRQDLRDATGQMRRDQNLKGEIATMAIDGKGVRPYIFLNPVSSSSRSDPARW
jgi:hypothetical protein